MCKKPERKEFPSCHGGTSLTTDPRSFDARKRQIVSRKQSLLSELTPSSTLIGGILSSFGRFAWAEPRAERWQSG